MQDIGLLLGVAAVFSFGWFVMKRLDAFLKRNAQEIQERAAGGAHALRIAFSDPMAAGAVSRTLELICKAHPDTAVYLYTADANIILARLHGGQLDAAIIPCETAGEKSSQYGREDVLVRPSAVVVQDAALPLCPLETKGVLQQLIWVKGACNGVAEDFAAQAAHDLQQQAGNACWEKV